MMSLKLSDRPKQYKLGWVEFYKLRFKVTPDTLIPRPETELLVDEVLNFLQTNKSLTNQLTIIDIGTGAGNIAISLAKNLAPQLKSGNVNITATDVSSKALKVARQNAKLHQVLDKITFIQSDLLNVIARNTVTKQSISEIKIATVRSVDMNVPRNDGEDMIIVTNLPYIPTERIPYLDSSVKDFEPLVALDGGEDGFDLYRKLFAQVKKKVWRPKLIVGEIDYTHGELAQNEAQKYFPKAKVEVKTDLAHKQRILIIEQ